MFRLLDAVDACVCVFAPGGEVLYESSSLRGLPLTPKRKRTLLRRAGEVAEAGAVREGGRSDGHVALGGRIYRLSSYTVEGLSSDADVAVVVTIHTDGIAATRETDVVRPVRVARELGLTPREAEVAVLLARRRTNREIAARLSISVHTVRRHAERIFSKLDIRSRRQVADRLFGRGLLD